MPITHYVAETDGTNAISAVWVKPKGQAIARIFDAEKDRFEPDENAIFSGASEAEITRWLLQRANQSDR